MAIDLKAGSLQIKGLRETVADARREIGGLRVDSADLALAVRALRADVQSARDQVKTLHADLIFDAETLGNSQANSATTDGAVQANPADAAHLAEVK